MKRIYFFIIFGLLFLLSSIPALACTLSANPSTLHYNTDTPVNFKLHFDTPISAGVGQEQIIGIDNTGGYLFSGNTTYNSPTDCVETNYGYDHDGYLILTGYAVDWYCNVDSQDFDVTRTMKLLFNKTFVADQTGNNFEECTFNISLEVPTVSAITVATSPVEVNSAITASANFSDPDSSDTHTASWDWGDGNTTTGTVTETNGSGSVSNSHSYTATGVYTVTLTVTDNHGATGTATYQYVAVYDSSAGWVSGDKEFTSPAGAVTGNSSATGKANFGFQVKYQNGSMVPSGKNVSLSFPTGNITFSSTGYEWLVISGSKATFKADGTLNGTSGYTLLVSAIDQGSGNPSGLVRFQIKDSGGNVVYDTQPSAVDTADPTTSVTKGKIAVH